MYVRSPLQCCFASTELAHGVLGAAAFREASDHYGVVLEGEGEGAPGFGGPRDDLEAANSVRPSAEWMASG